MARLPPPPLRDRAAGASKTGKVRAALAGGSRPARPAAAGSAPRRGWGWATGPRGASAGCGGAVCRPAGGAGLSPVAAAGRAPRTHPRLPLWRRQRPRARREPPLPPSPALPPRPARLGPAACRDSESHRPPDAHWEGRVELQLPTGPAPPPAVPHLNEGRGPRAAGPAAVPRSIVGSWGSGAGRGAAPGE